MNKNIWMVIGVVALIAIIVGLYSVTKSTDKTMMTTDTEEQSEIAENKDIEKDILNTVNDQVLMDTETIMIKTGSYESYSADKLAMAETGDVILFFHASWCPSCRKLNKNIEENINSIPENVHILKLDYDKEIVLKKKYEVTTQHTLVQVDADGTMIKKWTGGSNLDALVAQIL